MNIFSTAIVSLGTPGSGWSFPLPLRLRPSGDSMALLCRRHPVAWVLPPAFHTGIRYRGCRRSSLDFVGHRRQGVATPHLVVHRCTQEFRWCWWQYHLSPNHLIYSYASLSFSVCDGAVPAAVERASTARKEEGNRSSGLDSHIGPGCGTVDVCTRMPGESNGDRCNHVSFTVAGEAVVVLCKSRVLCWTARGGANNSDLPRTC